MASSKPSSPPDTIWCFPFQFTVSSLSLRSYNFCLRLPSRLPVTCILLSICPSITCFMSQFLRKMWPIQLAFILFTVCRIYLSFLTLGNTSSFTRLVQLIISILLQHHILKLPGISDLLFEASKLQHHTKLCSKCSTVLVSKLQHHT